MKHFYFTRIGLTTLGFLVASHAWPAETAHETSLGISVGLFGSQFIGGDSGPETLVSPTHYNGTFGTGVGGRVELFKDFNPTWRGQIGVVHTRWSGKNFSGGEFPSGAKLGKFNLTAIYAGAKAHVFETKTLQPYVVGNLGAARLPSVSITTGGMTQPYWSSSWTSYLELGAGVGYPLSSATVLTSDLRLQLFGAPKSANHPISDATGGSALLFSVGLDFNL